MQGDRFSIQTTFRYSLPKQYFLSLPTFYAKVNVDKKDMMKMLLSSERRSAKAREGENAFGEDIASGKSQLLE